MVANPLSVMMTAQTTTYSEESAIAMPQPLPHALHRAGEADQESHFLANGIVGWLQEGQEYMLSATPNVGAEGPKPAGRAKR